MKTKFTLLLIFVAAFFFSKAQQQPLNGGMNTWTNPLHPDNWGGIEGIANLSTNVFTFEDLTDKVEGTSSLKVITDTVPGYPQFGIVGGITSGTAIPFTGFLGQAFTGRPDTVIFDYKLTVPNGPDTATFSLTLFQNGNNILQAGTQLAPQTNWTHVTLPLASYYTSGVNPDTLKLEFKACGGGSSPKKMGNIMHIDNVRFGYAAVANAPEAYTMGHDPLGSHNFNFYGAVNAHGTNTAYSFVYSTDSTFATSTTTTAQNDTNNTWDVRWATVNGLAANTTYFYYFTATSANGTSNGDHMRFNSDTIPFLFENNGADVYSNSYAELNGKVNGFQNNAALSFEYGLTPAMGMTTTSDYPTVSDANTHYFRGVPSPLTPTALYFFRIKAATATDSIYSDIRAFYMGTPYMTLQTVPATNVTSSSADLHGTIQGFPVPIKINSEIDGGSPMTYFHSPLDYHDVTSPVINYTYNASHLQANQHYSTRLKVDTWIGNYYGADSAFTTLSTGLADVANSDNTMLVYPNPSTGNITVDVANGLNEESTIQLLNLNGQLVKEVKISALQNKTFISVTDIESGLYFLRLVSGNTICNKKINILK